MPATEISRESEEEELRRKWEEHNMTSDGSATKYCSVLQTFHAFWFHHK